MALNETFLNKLDQGEESFDSEITWATIDPGEYTANCKTIQKKTTQSGEGKILVIEFLLNNGRRFWHNVVFSHKNGSVEEIGKRTLAFIAKSIGIQGKFTITDLITSMQGKEFELTIGLRKDKEGHDRNTLTRIKLSGPKILQT